MRVFNGRPDLEMDKPSSSHLDMDDVPIGSIVKTPSGRVGVVIKHRGAESKLDLFQRVVIKFYEPLGDSVVLQPHLLTIIGSCPQTMSDLKK